MQLWFTWVIRLIYSLQSSVGRQWTGEIWSSTGGFSSASLFHCPLLCPLTYTCNTAPNYESGTSRMGWCLWCKHMLNDVCGVECFGDICAVNVNSRSYWHNDVMGSMTGDNNRTLTHNEVCAWFTNVHCICSKSKFDISNKCQCRLYLKWLLSFNLQSNVKYCTL